MAKHRILIVEDHADLAENLFEYLGEEHYELDYAPDGLTALHLLSNNQYDLIVLDIMLPGVDGISICERVRQDLKSAVPIIMLTAIDTLDDKVKGFLSGADDYLVKPFHMRELELRIQVLCRRQQGNAKCLKAGLLEYYPGSLTLTVPGYEPVVLSGHNATIFELLIRQYPNYAAYEDIGRSLWGDDSIDLNSLRTHVYTLRKLLKKNMQHDFVATLHGRGYKLTPPEK